MSGQTNQRVRKNASPSMKTGPIRATFPFGLRQGGSPTPRGPSGGGRKNSPSTSPTPLGPQRVTAGPSPSSADRKPLRSPDHRASPDSRASPSSPFFKDKTRSSRHSPSTTASGAAPQIKRTSSLDTYLKGEWPRNAVVPVHTLAVPGMGVTPPTADMATQTPDELWDEPSERKKRSGSHIRSTSLGNGDALKKETIKARLAKSKEGSRAATISGVQRNSPVPGNHSAITMATVSTTTTSTRAVSIPHIPKPTIQVRGSVEGLSQEIETLVLRNLNPTNGSSFGEELNRTQDPTPDGHRAPIAELLTTRNVDTQTPLGAGLVLVQEEEEEEEEIGCSSPEESGTSSGSSPSPSDADSPAPLPIIPGHMDSSRPSSHNEGLLKENTDCVSPNLKSFSFAREPPDGCEKVKTVHEENTTGLGTGPKPVAAKQSLFCPIKQPTEKCCIPSEVSAFCQLLKPYVETPLTTMGRHRGPVDTQPI